MSAPALQVDLLESSFALLAPRAEELAERFYSRLFDVAPEVRPLFPEDMATQKRALISSLAVIVGSLRQPEHLAAYLDVLGRRHVDYGAIAAHYSVVGGVLVETLAAMAGPVWSAELEEAWTVAYGAVQTAMLAAAAGLDDAAA